MTAAPAPASYHLSARQKWKLALSLVIIYFPIHTYLNFPEWHRNWDGLLHSVPLLLTQVVVMLGFYFIWLNLVEWIQQRLFGWFGEDFLLELKLPAQLATLLVSMVLAAGFILVYSTLIRTFFHLLPGLRSSRPPGLTPEHMALHRRANDGFFLMLMLSAFYLVANSRALLRVRAFHLRTEQLENENLQARFAALKSQVNPHFLFNSLSILSSLVHVDADLSEQFIDQLSRAYRYTLEQREHDLVALGTELDFIRAYTFLLKIRFEDKFDVHVDVPEAARHAYQIAPLTLQLLVENAVKHNTMSQQEPLLVRIGLDGDTLVVRNTLQRRPASYPGTGVGLDNIHNRYRLLTARLVSVAVSNREFTVRIPLLPA
ncbi:histidine kinase [Hymenobacter sp. 15J16-1T3B]|uniref:sensor histidine kinase n=1 Tax=Hymenobacter sp. 15J16-1T3B TaxID=2886941 RepID=UPI001D12A6CE|nr:histidine kinase [Hymenobacter sp. 15J16-1T3B]MCC3156498.1 histidine kinase [Hymenobacter sp. 15J16-1T3B]